MSPNLILRTSLSPYGDITKGSVLSQAELDSNFINIKGDIIYSAVTSSNTVTLKKFNGNDLSFNVDTGGNQWNIPENTTVTINDNYQGFIYGDLFVDGNLQIDANAQFVVLNGDIYVGTGGTITGAGTIYNISLPTFDTTVTGGTYFSSGNTIVFTNNTGGTFSVTGITSTNSNTYENIDFSDLHTKLLNSELTPLQWYRITDYKSVNFLNGYTLASQNPTPIEPSFDPREVYVSQEEVLLVQALSNNELSPIAYSEKFPDDIIHFNPYINKLGLTWQYYNASSLPDGVTTLSGFDLQWDGTNVYFEMPSGYPALYGTPINIGFTTTADSYNGFIGVLKPENDYTSGSLQTRVKVENNNTKIILLDVPQSVYNDYVSDTLFVTTNYEFADMRGYITRREDTFYRISVPFDFRNRVYRRYEIDLSSVISGAGFEYVGIGDFWNGINTTGNYIDVLSLPYTTKNIFYVNIEGFSSTFQNYMCDNVFLDVVESFKAGRLFEENTLGSILSSTVGDEFHSNCIVNELNHTNVGSESYNNILFNSLYNNIGYNFSANRINGRFTNNEIKNNFNSNEINRRFQNNKIFDYFFANRIGDGFYSNVIYSSFSENLVGDDFQQNIIQTDIIGVDFTSVPATYVYGDYTKTIFKNSSGNPRLSYIDGTDTINYDDIDA